MTSSRMSLLVVLTSGGLVAALFLAGVIYIVTRKGEVSSPFDGPTRPGVLPRDPDEKNPGEKILLGADRAYRAKYFETALKFYKDFELRYAGSETYDAHTPEVWEKIQACDQAMPKRDESLPAYLDARKKLDADWRQLRLRPAAEAREDLRAFLGRLPGEDGRRTLVEGRLAQGQEKK